MLEARRFHQEGDLRAARLALVVAHRQDPGDVRITLARDVLDRDLAWLDRAYALTGADAQRARLELDQISAQWRTGVALLLSGVAGLVVSAMGMVVFLLAQAASERPNPALTWAPPGAFGGLSLVSLFTGIAMRADAASRRRQWAESHLGTPQLTIGRAGASLSVALSF